MFRRHETTADAGLFISAENTDPTRSPARTPARDLWEVHGRVVNELGDRSRMVSHLYWGTAEPNGNDPAARPPLRRGHRIDLVAVALAGFVKVNDYGPYDYHHDLNMTYPLQLMADLSFTLGAPCGSTCRRRASACA